MRWDDVRLYGWSDSGLGQQRVGGGELSER